MKKKKNNIKKCKSQSIKNLHNISIPIHHMYYDLDDNTFRKYITKKRYKEGKITKDEAFLE